MSKLPSLARYAFCVAISCSVSACAGGTPPAASEAAKAPAATTAATPPVPGTPAPALDVAAEYDKGAALAAAGKLSEARAIFAAAAKQDPGEEAIAAAVATFRDLDDGRITGDVVQRMFR